MPKYFSLTAIARGLGVFAFAAVVSALISSPIAAAGPAPSSVESDYIDILAANGAHIVGQDADELKLGYLLCALSQTNELPPNGSAAFMEAARVSKLCHHVSINGGPTGAQVEQGTDIWNQQQTAPGIADWNDVDPDKDGRPNSEDYFDQDPNAW
jgi:hypothetical protein